MAKKNNEYLHKITGGFNTRRLRQAHEKQFYKFLPYKHLLKNKCPIMLLLLQSYFMCG